MIWAEELLGLLEGDLGESDRDRVVEIITEIEDDSQLGPAFTMVAKVLEGKSEACGELISQINNAIRVHHPDWCDDQENEEYPAGPPPPPPDWIPVSDPWCQWVHGSLFLWHRYYFSSGGELRIFTGGPCP